MRQSEVPSSPVYDSLGAGVSAGEKRSVYFDAGKWEIVLTDQPALPAVFRRHRCATVAETASAVRSMVVRGAPAIGVTGAFGMVLAAREAAAGGCRSSGDTLERLVESKRVLDGARPTAVNLSWATARMLEFAGTLLEQSSSSSDLAEKLLVEAENIAAADIRVNLRMAAHGAQIVPHFADRPTNIIHHCNTGALATVDWGTALGVIHYCHKILKRNLHVWVDETRPRLQGSRLSAWELVQAQCPLHVIADGVAGSLLRRGRVDVVLFGADRVARNGDTVNKIGTFPLCCVAAEHGVPRYAVVPTSTIDLTCASGDDIEIEERGGNELTGLRFAGTGASVAPDGVPVYNPAFDNTPAKYLTGIITEEGICYPPFAQSLRKAKDRAERRIREEQAASAAAMMGGERATSRL
eukprot:g4762.t1